MWSRTFNLFKAVPVTWLMLFAAGLLWAADNTLAWKFRIEYGVAQRLLGAADEHRLWDGAWWTILTTNFHHGNVIHLALNVTFLWWLGRLLETRLGSWRYALFCLSSLAVSGAVQALFAPSVGLSGMLFAQFGLVWGWRRTDAWLQGYIRDEQILWGLIWLFLCLPLTWFNILPVGNAAHFSGCGYGLLTAQVCFGSRRARPWKPVFLISHVCLVPAFYFLIHPVWNGMYHWRRGDVEQRPAVRLRHYENAILCDPNLTGPWINLAIISEQTGDPHAAWDWILRGIRQHPSFQKAIDIARDLGSQFPNRPEREIARRRLREIFGDQAPVWEQRLLPPDDLPVMRPIKPGAKRPQVNSEPEPDTTVPFSLPVRALDELRRPSKKLPAPDPDAPGSAEEGRAV